MCVFMRVCVAYGMRAFIIIIITIMKLREMFLRLCLCAVSMPLQAAWLIIFDNQEWTVCGKPTTRFHLVLAVSFVLSTTAEHTLSRTDH